MYLILTNQPPTRKQPRVLEDIQPGEPFSFVTDQQLPEKELYIKCRPSDPNCAPHCAHAMRVSNGQCTIMSHDLPIVPWTAAVHGHPQPYVD